MITLFLGFAIVVGFAIRSDLKVCCALDFELRSFGESFESMAEICFTVDFNLTGCTVIRVEMSTPSLSSNLLL